MRFTLGLALAGCCFATCANAQSVPTTTMSGSIARTLAYGSNGWCAVTGSPTVFQRNGTGSARILFEEILYTIANGNSRPTYYRLSGQGRISFSSSVQGRMIFDFPAEYPAGVLKPIVRQYAQTYDADTRLLTVSFNLEFETCTVPISATIRH